MMTQSAALMTPPRSLTQLLGDLKSHLQSEKISIAEILEAFHERGFGFFLFIFALPAALPFPALGINAIIALPLLLLTTQQALGRHTIWVPQKIKRKTISSRKLTQIIDAAMPWMEKLQFLLRPRLGFITQGYSSNIIGALGVIMALSVTVPLPLTNTIPSLGIALMAAGILMRDGIAVLAGAIIGIAWVTLVFGVIFTVGLEGIDLIKETIKSLF